MCQHTVTMTTREGMYIYTHRDEYYDGGWGGQGRSTGAKERERE